MLKKSEDYSFAGVVLFLTALFLGFLFRFVGLEHVSAWGDEIASLYYAQHLDRAFFFDSHNPFYYALCRAWISIFPASILSLRFMFIFLSFGITSTTAYIFYKRRSFAFALCSFILMWLMPTDIIFSRQARHYSLYLELSFLILVLWKYRTELRSWVLWPVWAIYQLIHPFACIPVFFLLSWDFFSKKLTWYDLRFYLTTSFPLFAYYLIKFITFGKSTVLSNILWVSQETKSFNINLINLFAGDSFPFNQFYHFSQKISFFFIALIVIVFFLFNKKGSKYLFSGIMKFVSLYMITILVVEIISYFFTNIRMNRYYIYLIAFFCFGLLEVASEAGSKKLTTLAFILLLGLTSYTTFIFRPWMPYEWDDQNVASFKELIKQLPVKDVIICSNAFQMDYYFPEQPYKVCSEKVLRFHLAKKDFYLFDLNGNDKMLILFLINNASIVLSQKFNHSVFLSVKYPSTK